MKTKNASLDWLCNPEIFQVNREPAHSDHNFTLYGQESRQYLNGTWKFSYASCPAERKKDFYQRDFDIEALDNIEVPGHIQLQGYGRPQYVNVMYPWDGQQKAQAPEVPMDVNPVGSYVKDIIFDKNIMSGKRQYISFQGVESGMALWLNGSYVGYSEDSFTPSDFNLTPYLKEGENKLAVQVFKFTSSSWCEDQDFYRFSGIYRSVFLYALPELHVEDIRVKTLFAGDDFSKSTLEIVTKLNGNGKLRFTLKDREHVVFIKEADAENEISVAEEMMSPRLWSAEEPNLYQLEIEAFNTAGELVEYMEQAVGFRKFEMKNNRMLLNGKRIVFKGANRHDFSSISGRCVSYKELEKDIVIMKQNNINAIRTCHYPSDKRKSVV